MKNKICIFAGTTEGRQLASLLKEAAAVTVCVATEYGEVLLDGAEDIAVHTGRMSEADMERLFAAERFERVIDATHPYATEVTENIAAAASRTGTPVLRVLREADRRIPGAVYVSSAEEARDWLAAREGNVLLTTGAKELSAFEGLDMGRVWARVLPLAASLEACEAAGIPAAHIVAAQGPFSYEMNLAQLRMIGAKYVVTKASGKTGGFDEKIAAAQAAGVIPVVIGQPRQTPGVCLDDAVALLAESYPLQKRKITVIGAGPGKEALLTAEAKAALREADAVIGAKSVTDALTLSAKPVWYEYLPQNVRDVLNAHPAARRAAVVMRGDVGFYSGAKKLLEALKGEDVTVLPGISSVSLFAAKLGVSWDDAALISLHGREANLVRTAARNEKTFVLAGGDHTPDRIFQTLCEYGMGGLACAAGERLSYPDETISRGTADRLKDGSYDPLTIVYIENAHPEKGVRCGIPDEEFIRGGVPMTKAEVRAVSAAKLAVDKGDVVWDIGAGTGSVSVECALAAYEGRVYAIEKNPEGVELIRQNKSKFRTDNLYEIEGTAPEALAELPAPTRVFIGGSGGGLKEILSLVFEKNPGAAVVINAVTLETQAEVMDCAKSFPQAAFEAVSVSVARAQTLGRYHLAAAQNPVWIYSLRGGNGDG